MRQGATAELGCLPWVPAVQVACGAQHTALLVEGGALLCWGAGTWGQTGHGSTANTCYPQRIERLRDLAFSQVTPGQKGPRAQLAHLGALILLSSSMAAGPCHHAGWLLTARPARTTHLSTAAYSGSFAATRFLPARQHMLWCPKLRLAAPGVCRRTAHAGPGLLGGPVGLGGCLHGPAGPRCVILGAHPMQADGLRQAGPAGGLRVRCRAPQLCRAGSPAGAPAARCCSALSVVLAMPVGWQRSRSCMGHHCMHLLTTMRIASATDAGLAEIRRPPAVWATVLDLGLSPPAWHLCITESFRYEQGTKRAGNLQEAKKRRGAWACEP